MIIPNKHNGYTRDGVRRVYFGSGDSSSAAPKPTTRITESGPSTSTLNRATVNEIPSYLTDASQDLIARGKAVASRPYEAYGGPRVAEFSPDMETAFGRMRNQGVAGQVGEATGLASLAGERAMQVGSSLGPYNPYEMGGFTADMARQYMNPYMQSVVDVERRKAQEASDQQAAILSGQAARQGAFGGSGAALQQRALRRDTAQQLGDIQALGLSKAYEQGLSRFGDEEARREASRQFGADYGLKSEELGLAGIRTGLDASKQLESLGTTQFGQEMEITKGLGTAGDIQRQREQALLDVDYGDYITEQKYPYEQLAFEQGLISGVPYSKTERISGQEVTEPGKIVSQEFAPNEQPNTASQLIGAGTALYGMTGDGAADTRTRIGTPVTNAAGGEIKRYAAGGIAALNQPQMASAVQGMNDQQVGKTAAVPGLPGLTAQTEQMRRNELRMAAEGQKAPASMTKITSILSQMSNAELQQYAKLNKSDPYTMALVVSEANRRKEGGMPTQEQPKVVDQQIASMSLPEDQGIAQLPVGNMEFAEGGIVAFAPGGDVGGLGVQYDAAKQAYAQSLENLRRYGGAKKLADPSGYEAARAAVQQAEQALQAAQSSWSSATQGMAGPVQLSSGVNPLVETAITPVAATAPAAAPAAGISSLIQPSASRDQKLLQRQDPSSGGVAQALEVQKSAADADRMSAPPGVGGLGSVMGMIDAERDRSMAVQEEISKQRAADIATSRGELSEAEKMAREFGSERETRYKKQEEGLEKSEKDNINMTFIEAGLAIMAGESSNALLNIAKGARQGLKGYEGRLEKIRTGREKLDESMSRLAEIREEKLSAVGENRRQLNALERQAMLDGKIAQEAIASGVAGKKITMTAEQAKQVNARSFDIWKYKQERADAESRTARSETQAISVNLRAIADEANSAMRNLTPGEPEYVALAAQRDMALAQLAKMSGLKSGSTATSRLKFDARGNPIK
jgi:hypothetical protein